MHDTINLNQIAERVSQPWSPVTVATFNRHDVMVVRAQGEFVWHSHPDTDDLFLVLGGELRIRLEDREVVLGPGDLFVVPSGDGHQPYAPNGATLLLLEPSGTPNTGDPATAAPRRLLDDAPPAPRHDHPANGARAAGDGRLV